MAGHDIRWETKTLYVSVAEQQNLGLSRILYHKV